MLVERDLGSIPSEAGCSSTTERPAVSGRPWRGRGGTGVQELHVLVEGADGDPAGVVARRAAEMAQPPSVWAVDGRRSNRR